MRGSAWPAKGTVLEAALHHVADVVGVEGVVGELAGLADRRAGQRGTFDADQAGTDAWRKLAKGAVMRGKRVETLTISAYGGEKDVAAAWAAGVLEVGSSPAMSSGGHSNEEAHREAYDERAAIMEYEAGLSREEAEEAARSQ